MIYDFDPLYSAYPQLKNKTFKFLGTDDELRYSDHMNNPEWAMELEVYDWYNQEIDYKINSHGFRSDEFEDSSVPSILFLGCSYTVGIGIRIEESFTTIISKELGLKNYNLGLGGGGADSSFRIGHYWIPKLKPKYVCFMNIFVARFEVINKPHNIPKAIVPLVDWPNDKNPYRVIAKKMSADHWRLNNLRNLYALKHVCDKENIPIYNITEFEILDYGRDLIHPGRMSNEQVAEDILTQIKN